MEPSQCNLLEAQPSAREAEVTEVLLRAQGIRARVLAHTLKNTVDQVPGEVARRMSALRHQVLEHDVYEWSARCLEALDDVPAPPA